LQRHDGAHMFFYYYHLIIFSSFKYISFDIINITGKMNKMGHNNAKLRGGITPLYLDTNPDNNWN